MQWALHIVCICIISLLTRSANRMIHTLLLPVACLAVESSWNVMAHGDAREGKWRGNWRMECVASTLPRNTVYPALLPLMCTPRLPVVDWTDAPHWFKRTRPFRRKTKSGLCACAITFQRKSSSGELYRYVPRSLQISLATIFTTCVTWDKTWDKRCA